MFYLRNCKIYTKIFVSIYATFLGTESGTELGWVYRANISRLQYVTILLVLIRVTVHPHTTDSVTANNWHR